MIVDCSRESATLAETAKSKKVVGCSVIGVKLEYELSVDPRERDALEALLAGGGAQLSCVDADTTSPTVAISSDAGAPVTGPFSITVTFLGAGDRLRAR